MNKSKARGNTPHPTKTITKAHHAADENGDGEETLPLNPDPIGAQIPTRQTSCKPNDTPWWWRAFLEVTAVAAGVVAIIIYKGQWDAAAKANQLSLDNFRTGQRPWVGARIETDTILRPKIGFPVEWRIHFRNYGNSPALKVHLHTRLFSPTPYASINWGKVQSEIAELPLDETQEFTIFNGSEIPNTGKSRVYWRDQDEKSVNEGTAIFLLGGRVVYEDALEHHRHTSTFCIIYVPSKTGFPSSWQGCPTNDVAD